MHGDIPLLYLSKQVLVGPASRLAAPASAAPVAIALGASFASIGAVHESTIYIVPKMVALEPTRLAAGVPTGDKPLVRVGGGRDPSPLSLLRRRLWRSRLL